MNLSEPIIHEIDTRQTSTLTVFDGSRDDESKLAKNFWNSVILMPPVESTLVCKEIHQRTRSRPLNDTSKKGKLTAAMIKAEQERTFRNKEYEEMAALKQAEDEGKQIQSIRDRHQQLRQLFFKQARTNRLKYQEWAVPSIHVQSHGTTLYFREETPTDVDYDRQLVRSLPD